MLMNFQLMVGTFIISFLALVHGYTPTFRNEATHPLKAPTESTLQTSEESSGRTNSNIQRHEPYFTGGKHFEYMLLNGSNVLLTSLQNDIPYDNPPEQPVSSKTDYVTKSDFSLDKIHPSEEAPPKPNVTETNFAAESFRLDFNKNFTSVTSLKNSRNSTWLSVHSMPEQIVTKFSNKNTEFRKFNGLPDISSTTKLYSKQANKSQENFASFTSPIDMRPVDNALDVDVLPEKGNKSVQKQIYDYDDSFTKLLISNGIIKPENETVISNEGTSSPTPSSEPPQPKYQEKVNSTSISGFNGSVSPNYNLILQDRRSSVHTSNVDEIVEKPLSQTVNPSNTLSSEEISIVKSTELISTEVSSPESSTNSLIVESFERSSLLSHDEVSTNSATVITSNIPTEDLNVDESPNVASAETNTLSLVLNESTSIKQSKPIMYVEKLPRAAKKYTTRTENDDTLKKTLFLEIIKPDIPTMENATNEPVKIYVKSFASRKVDDTPDQSFNSLTKFYPITSSKSSDTGINGQHQESTKNVSQIEFKNLIEKSIKHLFFPVAKYFNSYGENFPINNLSVAQEKLKNFKINLDNSKDVKVTLKSFTFTNLVEFLKNKTKRNKDEQKMSRVDRDLLQIEPKDSIFNWTDLNGGKSINLEDSVNELFSEEDEVHWFVLLLAGNSTIAQMRKEDFIKYLKVNLAARLSLEYNDIKINAIIVVPPNLAVNVSLPANESSVDVNEEVNVEESQKIDSIHELANTNATLLELSGQEYHVVQLLSLKSQQSVQNSNLETTRIIDTKHDDIELSIYIMLGATCIFGVLSPLLYGAYKLIQVHRATLSFKVPMIFRENFQQSNHEKMTESRSESLNVIFSEDFDKKYSSNSWFDNTQHSSSILKPSTEVATFFPGKGDNFPDFGDITRNPIENSPRLNKDTKLNILSCRPSCVLLPHRGRYPTKCETDERYFDNPNYNEAESR